MPLKPTQTSEQSSPDRDQVEVLAEEFLERYRQGERPSVSEYASRHPDLADEIRELFPALVMMEDVRPAQGDVPRVTADEPLSLRQLGDFRIIREVGRGGMGVVYEAEQVSLGRRVALKVLPKQVLLDSKHAKRFEREARAAARLHHTNIVPVFGVGQQDGLHYYVMQFIHGLGLDEVLVELKRLREANEFPHTAVEHQIASVVAAGAAEKAAVGRDVSALHVAQSLVSGQFERTLLVDSWEESGDGSQKAGVGGQKSGKSAPTLPSRSTINDQPSTLDPTTAVGRFSDTFPLPGQSEHSSRAQSRSVYWQSVARMGVQAAEALQYAHDQGVIHRDVKPGNLLLDTRGCVWVTDFGLAKATDQQDLTHTGDVLGTLRYMAPEQFNGQADSRSDVYSLGLTLYELLALQPGFDEKDRHRLIKQVTTGTPVRLRTIDAHIPRDLETIVHKAIDREPGQRYQTAAELAADLQRYLGNEPIRARWVSPVTRFTRWCKRNPAGASAVALLVLCLCGSILGAALIADERNRTEDALTESEGKTRQLLAQNVALERERQRVDEQRQRAEKEKQRAEENHRRARDAVDRLLTQVAQSLEDKPQMEPIRRALLEDALEFYQVFLQQKGRDPTIRYETGMAFFRVADIERQLSRAQESIQHYDEATRIFSDLAEEFPSRSEYREQLANCNLRYGTALKRLNRFKDAEAAYGKALAGWESLAAERPQHAPCLEELARVNAELGGFWSRRYFYAKGYSYLKQADELLAQLARDFPNYPVDPIVKLKVPDLLRATAHTRGEPPQAIRQYQPQYFRQLPHDAESLARYDREGQEYVMQWEKLVEQHPDVPDYRKSFQAAGIEYVCVLLAQDRFEEAEHLYERLLVEIRRLVDEYPDVPEYRVGLGWNEFDLADLLYLTGQQAEAVEHYRIAIDTAGKLVEEFPDELRFRSHLADMLIDCPVPQFQDGERAEQNLRRALQLAENPQHWASLGRAQMLTGHYADAMKSFDRARELGVKNAPLYVGEAFMYCHLGRLDEARKSYQQGLDWLNNTQNGVWYVPEARIVKKEFEELLRKREAELSAENKPHPQDTQ